MRTPNSVEVLSKLFNDSQAEIFRLTAEVERLTEERDAARNEIARVTLLLLEPIVQLAWATDGTLNHAALSLIAHHQTLTAENATLRRAVEELQLRLNGDYPPLPKGPTP